MKKYNKINSSLLKQLPEFSPKPELWSNIETQLAFNQKLKEKIKELPVYEPNESLWNNIESKINYKKEINKHLTLKISLSIAASILLLLGIGFLFKQKNTEPITVTEEVADDFQYYSSKNDSLYLKASDFIDEQCRMRNYLCSKPDFQNKKMQLNEINSKIEQVNSIIEHTGSSPSLVETLTKLENMRSRLVKNIIYLITS